jgi:hydroxyacylglutathione hydrolase
LVTVIQNITNSPWGNSDFLICEESSGLAMAVDPWDLGILRTLAGQTGYKVASIFVTHTHGDHIAGTQDYLSKLSPGEKPLPIFCHDMGAQQISGTKACAGGDLFMGDKVTVVATPGHRPEHLSLYLKEARWRRSEQGCGLTEPSDGPSPLLIAGDCLFDSGVGNCTNGGDVSVMYDTVSQTLMRLAGETIIFSGHDYRIRNLGFAKSVEPENIHVERALQGDPLIPSTISEQMLVNPFFRFNEAAIEACLSERGLPNTTPSQRFSSLRHLRDRW